MAKYIREELNTTIRNYTKEFLNKRTHLVSKDEAVQINRSLKSSEHKTSVFKYRGLTNIISSNELNTIFDNIFVDHTIMMTDVELLFSIFKNIIRDIKSKYVDQRIRVKNGISLIKNYLSLKKYAGRFNFVEHISVVDNDNYSTSRDVLVIDKEVGIVHLPIDRTITYSGESNLNIYTEVISMNVQLIEESDSDLIFDSDLLYYDLFYSKQILNTNPRFSGYSGVIIKVVLEFATIAPVNELRMRFISDLTHKILGIGYILDINTNKEVDINEYKVINNSYVSGIYFNTINAKKIVVYVGTDLFKEVKYEVITDGTIKQDFIDSIKEEVYEILSDRSRFNTEIIDKDYKQRLHDSIYYSKEKIETGGKIYILGIKNIEALYRTYKTYGTYETKPISLNGNLTYIAVEDESYTVAGSISINKVVINNKEYSLGTKNLEGKIIDTSVIKIMDISNPHRRYAFETNFIPDDESVLKLYINDIDISNDINISIIEKLPSGNRYYFKENAKVIEDSIVISEYTPSEYDRNNVAYDPSKLDIIKSIGKPNIVNQLLGSAISTKVYVYDSLLKLSMYDYTEVEIEIDHAKLAIKDSPIDGNDHSIRQPDSFYPLNGEVFGTLGILTITDDGDEGYIHYTGKVFGPYSGGMIYIKETLKIQSGTGLLYKDGNPIRLGTTYPYVSNMIFCETVNGKPLPIIEHASVYGDRDDFCQIRIDFSKVTTSDDVVCIYTPIPDSNGIIPNESKSNIEKHNVTTVGVLTEKVKELSIQQYPFIDINLIEGNMFNFSRGTWFYKYNPSIIYEPFVIYVDGRKLEYLKDYTTSGKNLTFNNEISGNITIKYYKLADNITFKINMFRYNQKINDKSPMVASITALGKVAK